MKSPDDAPQRLLAVARDLFTRQGYEGTSVRQITTRAKANLGAITYHFGSKRELYYATIATMADPLAEKIAAAAGAPGAPLDRVVGIVRAFLEHVVLHPGAPTCLLRELASDRPVPPPLAAVMQRNLGTIAQTIAEGQRDGSIRPGDPRVLVLSVVPHGFYLAVAGRLLKGALGVDLKDAATRAIIIDNLAESIRRSLRNDSKARS